MKFIEVYKNMGITKYSDIIDRIDFNEKELKEVQLRKRARLITIEEVKKATKSMLKQIISDNSNLEMTLELNWFVADSYYNYSDGENSTIAEITFHKDNVKVHYKRGLATCGGTIADMQQRKSNRFFRLIEIKENGEKITLRPEAKAIHLISFN